MSSVLIVLPTSTLPCLRRAGHPRSPQPFVQVLAVIENPPSLDNFGPVPLVLFIARVWVASPEYADAFLVSIRPSAKTSTFVNIF